MSGRLTMLRHRPRHGPTVRSEWHGSNTNCAVLVLQITVPWTGLSGLGPYSHRLLVRFKLFVLCSHGSIPYSLCCSSSTYVFDAMHRWSSKLEGPCVIPDGDRYGFVPVSRAMDKVDAPAVGVWKWHRWTWSMDRWMVHGQEDFDTDLLQYSANIASLL